MYSKRNPTTCVRFGGAVATRSCNTPYKILGNANQINIRLNIQKETQFSSKVDKSFRFRIQPITSFRNPTRQTHNAWIPFYKSGSIVPQQTSVKHDEQASCISLNFQHQSHTFSILIPRPTMPQRDAISQATWECHQAEIQILYQEKSLREVITYMEENHRFVATLLSPAFFPSSNS